MLEMTTSPSLPVAEPTDAELVALSLAGQQEAFGQIVARYQSLVCALAYSASGSMTQSEDLAQETFINAWQHLAELREPEKLRGWLCMIVRNRAKDWQRGQGRELTQLTDPLTLDEIHPTPESAPSTQAIRKDEEAILWRALEQVPELYREPLVLYYRQHQSLEHVAVALDLSEDAVKQRLSRGRKMLSEQVEAIVEGSLARTGPGQVFTANVMAALPMASASMGKTTTLAVTTTAKGLLVATKATGMLGVLNILLGPLIGILAGALGVESGLKALSTNYAAKDIPQTPEERKASREARLARLREFRDKLKKQRQIAWAQTGRKWRAVLQPKLWLLAVTVVLGIFVWTIPDKNGENPFLDSHKYLVVVAGLILIGLSIWSIVRFHRTIRGFNKEQGAPYRERQREINKKGRKALVALIVVFVLVNGLAWVPAQYLRENPALVTGAALGLLLGAIRLAKGMTKLAKWQDPEFPGETPDGKPAPGKEYRSPCTFLGLPLLHIHTGRTMEGRQAEARGWVAVGGRAIGVLAIGRTAFGVVSIGPAAVGLLAIGGIAIAPLAIGCLAIGQWAAGGMALGMLATGGLALGWQTAYGTFALAHHTAFGDIAYAANVNDDVARAVVTGGFFPAINWVLQTGMVTGVFTIMFGFSTYLIAHFSAFIATKEERAQSGREVTSQEIIREAWGLPAIYSLVVAGLVTGYVVQHWKQFEALPFGESGIPAIAAGAFYLLAVAIGTIAVALSKIKISREEIKPGHLPFATVTSGENPVETSVEIVATGPSVMQSTKARPKPPLGRTTIAFGLAALVLIGAYLAFTPKSNLAQGLIVIPLLVCIFAFDIMSARHWATGSKAKAGWEAFLGDAGSLALFSVTRYTGGDYRAATLVVVIAAVLTLRLAGARLGVNNRLRWKYARRIALWATYGCACALLPTQSNRTLYLIASYVVINVVFVLVFWGKDQDPGQAPEVKKQKSAPEKL